MSTNAAASAIRSGLSVDESHPESEKAFKPNTSFIKVYTIFMESPKEEFSGSDVCKKSGLRSGVVYPLLHELEKKGWLTGEWENTPPENRGRPQKKLYRSTFKGVKYGHKLISNEYPSLQVALKNPVVGSLDQQPATA